MGNQEYHDFLDALEERKMSGEITLYFQGGCIESSRISERFSKSEIQARMAAKKRAVKAIAKFPKT